MGDKLEMALEERYAELCMGHRRALRAGATSDESTDVEKKLQALEAYAEVEGYTFHK